MVWCGCSKRKLCLEEVGEECHAKDGGRGRGRGAEGVEGAGAGDVGGEHGEAVLALCWCWVDLAKVRDKLGEEGGVGEGEVKVGRVGGGGNAGSSKEQPAEHELAERRHALLWERGRSLMARWLNKTRGKPC